MYENFLKGGEEAAAAKKDASSDIRESKVTAVADEVDNSGVKACSVKLFDIKKKEDCEVATGGVKREATPLSAGADGCAEEPSVKKAKGDDGSVSATPERSKEDGEKTSVPSNSSPSGLSLENAVKLLSPQKDSKVTISPVRPKDKASNVERSNSVGSVTITKLSTGTSQRVESKDLKTLLGSAKESTNGLRLSPSLIMNNSSSVSESKRPVKKSPNSYSVEVHKKQHSSGSSKKLKAHKDSLRCLKECKQSFSTKEALRLHTCHSKLDQRYLTDANVRASQGNSREQSDQSRSSSPVSSLSRGSSRSNSPVFNQAKTKEPAAASSSSPPTQMPEKQPQAMVKLIKDEKDASLKIEGRPKLTISKVSQKTIDTQTGLGAALEKKVVAKLKVPANMVSEIAKGAQQQPLPPPPPTSMAAATAGFAADGSDSDSNSVSKSGGGGSGGLKKKLTDSKDASPSPSFTGKLKIRIGDSLATAASTGVKKPEEEGGFPYVFVGKPTYSPSRVEPSTSLPGKGERQGLRGRLSTFTFPRCCRIPSRCVKQGFSSESGRFRRLLHC